MLNIKEVVILCDSQEYHMHGVEQHGHLDRRVTKKVHPMKEKKKRKKE